jgi:hypothetical protein
VQAQDAELAAIAGLTSAADRLPYFTGSGAASLATFTAAGRALVDDADAAAQRTTLGVGLVYITSATMSAASSVSVDNCFSATYENYLVVIDLTAVSVATLQYQYMRLRVAGVDASAASTYKSGGAGWDSVGGNALDFETGTGWRIAYSSASDMVMGSRVTLYRPFVNIRTFGETDTAGFDPGGVSRRTVLALGHETAASYDGFTVYPASGTLTGTIRVYGYL